MVVLLSPATFTQDRCINKEISKTLQDSIITETRRFKRLWADRCGNSVVVVVVVVVGREGKGREEKGSEGKGRETCDDEEWRRGSEGDDGGDSVDGDGVRLR